MQLQIGTDNFGKTRVNNLTFVDKTLFIKEILDNKGIEVSIITRPRRFGKSFNLSTLHHFLAPEVNNLKTADLFIGLKIAEIDNGHYMQQQGKYPVIMLSFKDAKSITFAAVIIDLQDHMKEVFRNYQYLKISTKLSQEEKDLFISYFKAKDRLIPDLKTSLRLLCELLYKHHGVKPWLLIDEYDTPIQLGYLNNYYDEIVGLMRNMLGGALKTNPYLDRAVITGILRIAKESLFSDLNNPKAYSILQSQYNQYFGFTETEVHDLLQAANLNNKTAEVKRWYNGYIFGGTTVYNPWSIVNCIDEKGLLQAYWVNTGDDKLIKDILTNSDPELKKQFSLLLQDEEIIQEIDENMVFENLKTNKLAVWSLLLMSGYLKVVHLTLNDRGDKICHCAIPNLEVKVRYQKMIESWLSNNDDSGSWYRNFLGNLLKGDVESFKQDFSQVLAKIVSVHDTARNPENFYHGFMLGLTASLRNEEYTVKSNKESGYGRYDIVILPKDLTKYAIIFEFKSLQTSQSIKNSNNIKEMKILLAQSAQTALAQIAQKQYLTEIKQCGYQNILKLGLAFSNKHFSLATDALRDEN